MSYLVHKKNKQRFLYIHIPKTGGRSIHNWIEHLPSFDHLYKIEHGSVIDFEEFEYDYSFTIVRNPYDRAISLYKEAHRVLTTKRPVWQELIELDFDLDKWKKGLNYFIKHFITKDCFYKFTKPQTDFVQKNKRIAIDYIIKIENLHKDMQQIQNLEKVNFDIEHIGKGEYISEKLNNQAKSIIKDFYYNDFTNFSYNF